MKIIFNSKEIDVQPEITISTLKETLNVPKAGVAVAVNGKIVVNSQYETFVLKEGDDVIIIGAAYGG